MTFSSNFLFHFPLFSLLLLLIPSSALNLDGTLLLSFKYSVLSDPLSVLSNWDYSNLTPCSWTGVTCAAIPSSGDSPSTFRVTGLVLPNSQLQGTIPDDLGLIQHLTTLDLSRNSFNGSLPYSLFNASNLQVLSLSGNEFSGEIPPVAGGLSGLQYLNISNNAFAGKFPETFASLPNLTVISVRNNKFIGNVPYGFNLVQVLDLSMNLFSGSLPENLGGEKLRFLNLSHNNLNGSISPVAVKNIPANATIDFSFNNLTGEIPNSVALNSQKTDSFAGNSDLCGKPLKKLCLVPSTLTIPPGKGSNSSSPAIAAIPKNIDPAPVTGSSPVSSNGSGIQQKRGLNPGSIAAIVVGDLLGIGIIAIVILYVFQLKKKREKNRDITKGDTITVNREQKGIKEDSLEGEKIRAITAWSCLNMAYREDPSDGTGSDSDDYGRTQSIASVKYDKERKLVMMEGEKEMEMETLLKASAYVLGSSGASIVYRAVLDNGRTFAVRRIGENIGVGRLKDFENQVRATAKLRHPNLVRVYGFYWGDDEKLIIYEYISNGSLATAGDYNKKMGSSSPCHLSFEVRLKIARGVARGLTYIHDKKHVHANIKPTNILLNDDMEPLISDLGLDRLISKASCSTTRHFGSKRSTLSQDGGTQQCAMSSPGFIGCTSPYHAPESLENMKPNPKWDVYSFGVLLIELLTGRVFSDRELGQWTAEAVREDKNRVLRMADVAIRGDLEGREESLLACFRLGFGCASLVPQKRPSMKEALHLLEKIPCYSGAS